MEGCGSTFHPSFQPSILPKSDSYSEKAKGDHGKYATIDIYPPKVFLSQSWFYNLSDKKYRPGTLFSNGTDKRPVNSH